MSQTGPTSSPAAATAATGQWYYTENGLQGGPVPETTLRQLAAAGRIGPNDLIWREGMAQWTPARGALPGLFAAATAAAAPAVAPMPMPPMQPMYPGAYPGATLNYQGRPPPGGYHGTPPVDPAVQWLIPVGRSGWAIAAGYLGLGSLLCGLLGPFAIIVSFVALSDLRKNPGTSGMGRVVTGLVCGILGTLAVVAWFFFIGIREGR